MRAEPSSEVEHLTRPILLRRMRYSRSFRQVVNRVVDDESSAHR